MLTRSPLPRQPQPMLCTLLSEPFDNSDWVFEPKFDGLRVLARFDGRHIDLLSRNSQLQNFQFPDVADSLRRSLDRPAVVDGEVICFDEHGRSSFRALQQRFHLKDATEVRARMERYPAFIYLFDILHLDGFDVTTLALAERKRLLHDATGWSDRVLETEYRRGRGKAMLAEACRRGWEGIIGKHWGSRYEPGRSGHWVMIKCILRQEFVIGGFTEPQRSRVGLGALLVGYFNADGRRLCYAGKVGTGYTRDVLLDLRKRLGKLERAACSFDEGDPPMGDSVHWVEPKLVAEIAFAEWTQNGMLRQPRYLGLRPDKSPRECRRERPLDAGAGKRPSQR